MNSVFYVDTGSDSSTYSVWVDGHLAQTFLVFPMCCLSTNGFFYSLLEGLLPYLDLYTVSPFSSKVTDGNNSCIELYWNSQFNTDIKLSSTGQGSDDGWSCCNFHLQDCKLSESNILCRHTVATLRLCKYSQHLLLRGQILLLFLWSLVILTGPFNIIRYAWSCFWLALISLLWLGVWH